MSEPEGAALVACQRHQREGCPMCLSPIVLDESAAPASWKPFDAAVWLLNGRWSPVNGWSVVSTPEVWAGTLLLNGTHYRVTVEPVKASGPAFCDVTGNPRPCGCLDCAGPKQAGASTEASDG